MRPSHFTNAPTLAETQRGWIYYIFSFAALPAALRWFCGLLAAPLSEGRLNFLYYCINFLAAGWIFRRFLAGSMKSALRHPLTTLWYAALGYLGADALGKVLLYLLVLIAPGYTNANDLSVTGMIQTEPLLAAAVVLLVPVAEECLFRGLLFRNLYGRNPTAAYVISMVTFSAIHVVGYLGSVSPLYLLVSFLQYLPAAYCLCWCYHQTGTFITPILMHTLVNAMGVYDMMR